MSNQTLSALRELIETCRHGEPGQDGGVGAEIIGRADAELVRLEKLRDQLEQVGGAEKSVTETVTGRWDGVSLIAAERRRQIDIEGWASEHDDGHIPGALVDAAACYLDVPYMDASSYTPSRWPWEPDSWKPAGDPVRNLVKAGALIAAEIDRHIRSGQESEGRE